MKKIIIFFICCLSLLQAQQPGDLVKSELKLDISPGGVIRWIHRNSEEKINKDLTNYLDKIPFGLVGYKLTYKSLDYKNKLVNATGLVLFPKTNRKLSTVLFMSPTTNNRNYVPSNLSGTNKIGIILPIMIAMSEYIVVAPDYLGMGDGDGRLAYANQKTAASAGLDMLKAANQFLNKQGKKRYDEYFVGGYSQGAHAAMSIAKVNQEKGNHFYFKYLAIGAGPYDLSNTTLQKALLDRKTYPKSAFIAYIIKSCEDVGYKQTKNNWHDVISDEYYEKFKTAAIDNKGGLNWGPKKWRDLFQSKYIRELENNFNHPTRKCLRSNDVYDFYNTTPTTMFSSWFDRTIPPENDKITKKTQRSYYRPWDLGKYKIKTGTLGPWNHGLGSIPYTLAAIFKFNSNRKGGFFNLRAERTGEYLKLANNENNINIDYIPSTIAPSIKIKKNNISSYNLKRLNSENSFESVKKLNQIEENVSLVTIELPNGEQKVFPFLKEEATELDANDILSFENKNMIVDMKNWPSEIKEIHLIKDNEIVHSTKGSIGKKNYAFDLNDISKVDMVEVISNEAIFVIKIPKQKEISIRNNLEIINLGNKAKVFVNETVKQGYIYDMSGRMVKSIEGFSKQTEFSLKKGIYILNFVFENGKTESKKFIKE